jgi:ribosomal protein S14
MIFIRWPKREERSRFLYGPLEVNKLILKSLLSSEKFFFEDKVFFFKFYNKFYYKTSISFYRRSCLFTGHSRAVFRLFKLSRHQGKSFASFGFIAGLRKSSF